MGARVVVFVSGGMVQGVCADDDVNVLIVDYDVDGQDAKKFDTVDGKGKELPINVYKENVLEDVRRTSDYFDIAEAKETEDEDAETL